MEDLQLAFDTLAAKSVPYTTLMQYADGVQPLKYSTKRLQEAFSKIEARFSQNWCEVVINATLDRMGLKGWDAQSKQASNALTEIWQREGLALEAYEVHRAALITGEAFIIAYKTDDGGEDVYYNDPRMVAVFYDPNSPKRKRFAAKLWKDGDLYRMTLYYPDRMEYYTAKSKDYPTSYKAFQPDEVPSAPNPFDTIPVFHFRARGELNSILTLQDAVNKLFADMMVVGEYGAFPQRYVISNADVGGLKNAPNELWSIPASAEGEQQTSVGQFSPADLGNYLKAIENISTTIGVISRTPKHYFFSTSDVSGEALLAMEAPLIKKVEQKRMIFEQTWKELGAFLYRLSGGAIEQDELIPVWEPAGSVQPLTEAQATNTRVASGVPIVTALRWEGKSQEEIDQMQADAEEESKRNTTSATLLLEQMRTQDAQSNQVPGEGENENESTR